MISQLIYLADEVCSGVEIFYSGRTGGQSLKSAFILCDDYTELASKLFLLWDEPSWSEESANGGFKNYHQVLGDVCNALNSKRPADSLAVEEVTERMKSRRVRRNGFFHSARLLDLNVTERMCLEAFVDLLDYVQLLFGNNWTQAASGARSLDTYNALLRIDYRSLAEPQLQRGLVKLLAGFPRNESSGRKYGIQLAIHPNDLHLRLCVLNGGSDFLDQLNSLLR